MSDAKNRILARRAKFVTAALTTVLAACGSSTTEEAKDTGTSTEVGADTGPVPCLDMPPPDTGTLDTGGLDTGSLDTGSLDSSAADSGGVRDSADEDTGPTPCLKVPLDTGTD